MGEALAVVISLIVKTIEIFMQNPNQVKQAADFLRTSIQDHFPIRAGVILGTGLGAWVDGLNILQAIPYEDIPGFPVSTAPGHSGRLLIAEVGGVRSFFLQGRFHLYEGYSPAEVVMGVRTLAELGMERLVVTCAAGALNPLHDAGGLMAITDMINFMGVSPLTGPNHEAWGSRFPDMTDAFSPELRALAEEAAINANIRLERGIYIGVPGPNLETPAETRMLRTLGADAVGMSTVPEVIAARHMNVDVLGIACLTNKNLPDCMEKVGIEEIIAAAEAAGEKLAKMLEGVLPKIA
jgi:purine-nucleoside phosphorylase